MCTEYITTYTCHHHDTTSHILCRKLRRGECTSTEEINKKMKGVCGGCRERGNVDGRGLAGVDEKEKKGEGERSGEEGR